MVPHSSYSLGQEVFDLVQLLVPWCSSQTLINIRLFFKLTSTSSKYVNSCCYSLRRVQGFDHNILRYIAAYYDCTVISLFSEKIIQYVNYSSAIIIHCPILFKVIPDFSHSQYAIVRTTHSDSAILLHSCWLQLYESYMVIKNKINAKIFTFPDPVLHHGTMNSVLEL